MAIGFLGGRMLGVIADAVIVSLGFGAPGQPRTADEAGERFFFRSLFVALGLLLAIVGSLVAWFAEDGSVHDVAIAGLAIGTLMVLFGIPRLIQLWRAGAALRLKDEAEQ